MDICSTDQLELLSDCAGFVGSCIAVIPPLISSWVFIMSRRTLLRDKRHPGSVSNVQRRLAIGAIEKASQITLRDVACLSAGFALLILSFTLKLLAR